MDAFKKFTGSNSGADANANMAATNNTAATTGQQDDYGDKGELILSFHNHSCLHQNILLPVFHHAIQYTTNLAQTELYIPTLPCLEQTTNQGNINAEKKLTQLIEQVPHT
jgi:hypothetical protein